MMRVLLLAAVVLGGAPVDARGQRVDAVRAARHQRPCPKVFIYDLPAYWDYETPLNQLHAAKTSTIFGPPCKKLLRRTNQFAMPLLVMWRLGTSARCRRTLNPQEAELFLVPTYPKPKTKGAWEALCRSQPPPMVLPFLNERTAHRHVFLMGKGSNVHGIGCDGWWTRPQGLLQRAMRFAYSMDLNVSVGASEGRTYGPFAFDDDSIGVADHWNDHITTPHLMSVPYPTSFRMSPSSSPRPVFATFIGRKHGFYGTERSRLVAECKADRDCELGAVRKDPCPESAYTKAVFCFQPGGDTPYRKGLYDSIVAGCIPVVWGRHNTLVAPWFIPRDAVVRLNKTDYMTGGASALSQLRAISSEEIKRMQASLMKASTKIRYASEDVPGDAVETILRGARATAERRERELFPSRSLTVAAQHACGVLFVASGPHPDKYVAAVAATVERVAAMAAPTGWCKEEPALARYPVVVATDAANARDVFSERVAVLDLGRVDAPSHGLPAATPSAKNKRTAFKWWRPALFASGAVPFERTLSLDADAVACTDLSIKLAFREADRVEEAGGPLALVNAEWVNHERLERPARTVTTLASNVRATRPVLFGISRLAAGDVCDDKWHAGAGVAEEAARSCDEARAFKLNAGFCLFRRTEARPIFDAWARCVRAGLANEDESLLEDQHCFMEAVRANRTAPVGALSSFQVCRKPSQGSCGRSGATGNDCWFHHSHRAKPHRNSKT